MRGESPDSKRDSKRAVLARDLPAPGRRCSSNVFLSRYVLQCATSRRTQMALQSQANVKGGNRYSEFHYRSAFELAAAADVAFLHLAAPPALFQLRVLMSLRLLLAGGQQPLGPGGNSFYSSAYKHQRPPPHLRSDLGSLRTGQHVGICQLSSLSTWPSRPNATLEGHMIVDRILEFVVELDRRNFCLGEIIPGGALPLKAACVSLYKH